MTQFEKYLQENKEQLSQKEASPQLWLKIENSLLKRKNQRIIKRLKLLAVAASLVVLVAFSLVMFNKNNPSINSVLARNGINNQQFIKQVEQRKNVLLTTEVPINKVEDFNILLQQIEFLDKQYKDYLQYVETYGYQEFIGQQIVDYYQTKITLLDKIQQEIEKVNYYEKKYNKQNKKSKLTI